MNFSNIMHRFNNILGVSDAELRYVASTLKELILEAEDTAKNTPENLAKHGEKAVFLAKMSCMGLYIKLDQIEAVIVAREEK